MSSLINQIDVLAVGIELTIYIVALVLVIVGVRLIIDLYHNK